MDELFAAAGGSVDCLHVADDTAHYRFELPVTAELLAELKAALAAGQRPAIAFQIQGNFTIDNDDTVAENAVAGYEADVVVGILTADGDTRTIFKDDQMELTTSSKEVNDVVYVRLSQALVNTVMPGDNFVVEARAQGYAITGGCASTDTTAVVEWQIRGLEGSPDRPVVTGA